MKVSAPIVGMFFRPPAQKVLAEIRFGTPLILQRQPDNPHDPNAIQVLLPGFNSEGDLSGIYQLCLSEALEDDLPAGRGLWNKSSLTDPLFVGYVSAKTGEAAELAAIMDRLGKPTWEGELCGTLEGKPAVALELEINVNPGPIPEPVKVEDDDTIPF